ncbi:MAG: hypothetical protein ACOCUV_02630, partial [bacterium]
LGVVRYLVWGLLVIITDRITTFYNPKMINYIPSIIVALLITFFTNTNAQTLIFEERPEIAQNHIAEINDGNALLIFESELDLEFESSMEYFEQPQKVNNIYKLSLKHRTAVITVINPKTAASVRIAFGQQMVEGGFPSLQRGEIKHFEIKLQNRLRSFDDSDRQKQQGATDSQMRYLSEALLIINTEPADLLLDFSSTVEITHVHKAINRYMLYVKPEAQTISIKNPEVNAIDYINIQDIEVKEVRYYFVILPGNLRTDTRSIANNAASIKNILGYWGGNLGTETSYLEVQEINPKSGQVKGKIYQNDIYFDFTGSLNMSENDVFNMTLSKNENVFTSIGATVDMVFRMGIGSGYWINDNGTAMDITMMRVQSIPQDNTHLKARQIKRIKDIAIGEWVMTTPSQYLSSIDITTIDYKNNVQGTLNISRSLRCMVGGRLSETQNGLNLVLNPQNCSQLQGIIVLNIIDNEAFGTFTAYDGTNMVPLKLKNSFE